MADDGVVLAQVISLGALAWPGRARWRLGPGAVAAAVSAVAAGGLLAGWGARVHGTTLTPRVRPPAGAALLTSGPYAVSRNPIYGGLLVGAAGVAVLRRRSEPLLAWVALATVLSVKVRREEPALLERFGPAYEEYRRSTPRFVGVVRLPSGTVTLP